MDVYSIARACLRRWYVFLLVLAAAAALSYVQYDRSDAIYTRNETLLISPPVATATAVPVGVNPLGSVTNALSAATARLNAADVTRAADPTGTISLSAVASKKGAIISLQAVGSSSTGTENALASYAGVARTALENLQAQVGAPKETFFNLVVLKPDDGASVEYPSRSKTVGVTMIVGLLAAILLAEILDIALLGHRRRRQARLDTPMPRPGSPLTRLDSPPAERIDPIDDTAGLLSVDDDDRPAQRLGVR